MLNILDHLGGNVLHDENRITLPELDAKLKRLNTKKAMDHDRISNKIISYSLPSLTPILHPLYTILVYRGYYPMVWKRAMGLMILKPNKKKSDPISFRPISLFCNLGKVESIVTTRLYSWAESTNLLPPEQSGFRKKRGRLTRDSFNLHRSLRNAGNAINLLGNYLSSRKQRVVINGKTSEYFQVESGVHQGSVLGPLFFLIYISDLEIDIKSKIKFFSDDTMIYSVVHNPSLTAAVLNQDLKFIAQWAHQWKMSFNPEPSKQAVEILFSQKKIKPAHPPLFFNGLIVNKVNHHKHLGLILDSKLTFSNHFIEQINKSRILLGVLKLLSSYLPLHSLNQIYKMYIRSHLDYCDGIYHILPLSNGNFSSVTLHTLMESIARIQYQAALLISGTWKGTSRNKLYNELGWESLTDRRWCRRLINFYKIHNGVTPSYLRDNLPPKRRLLYGNDNPNVYHQFSCNTSRYKNSFYPYAIKTRHGIT